MAALPAWMAEMEDEDKDPTPTANSFCYENELAFISQDEEEDEEGQEDGDRAPELERLQATVSLDQRSYRRESEI